MLKGPETWRTVPLVLDVEETTVTLDAELASSLLAELIANALDAAATCSVSEDTPKEVYVGAGVEQGLQFEVADSGHGIPADILPFIFDPFFTTRPDGVGMGLTKARRMASELGMDIIIQQGDDGGVLVSLEEAGHQPTDDIDLAPET